MGEYTKNKKWPPDDPFFYRDGLDEIEIPDDVRKRREATRAESRARRKNALRELAERMVKGMERFDSDPEFRDKVQKRTF